MASERQIRANRRNAQQSTGPRTEEGKAAVRLNAVRHGLLSNSLLISGEDEAEFVKLSEGFYAQLQPEGELEVLLVDRIVASVWRLRRLFSVEAGIFYHLMDEPVEFAMQVGKVISPSAAVQQARGVAFIRDANGANAFSKLSRYETSIERGLYKALHELQRLQAARRGDDVPPPVVVDVDVAGGSSESQ